ncbi:hypothetical protein NC652_004850 [Populus alba x Populus x berolinensis]|nr:hypothetical protein NC652_004850 [Populus alba x Populus x berolinensis]
MKIQTLAMCNKSHHSRSCQPWRFILLQPFWFGNHNSSLFMRDHYARYMQTAATIYPLISNQFLWSRFKCDCLHHTFKEIKLFSCA